MALCGDVDSIYRCIYIYFYSKRRNMSTEMCEPCVHTVFRGEEKGVVGGYNSLNTEAVSGVGGWGGEVRGYRRGLRGG